LLRVAAGQTEELDGGFAVHDILKQCADALDGQVPQADVLLAADDLDLRSSSRLSQPIVTCREVIRPGRGCA
jgi:hypothetical protein